MIDKLVGHMAQSTRDQHYDGAEDPELIDAVRKVPPVLDGRDATNVVQLGTARG